MTALVTSMVHIATCSLVFASLILTGSSSTAAETVVLGSDELTAAFLARGTDARTSVEVVQQSSQS